MTSSHGKVLIIDDDRDISDIVSMVLTDAGFMVSILTDMDPDAIAAVGQLEPDCVLLNGGSLAATRRGTMPRGWVCATVRCP